MKERYYVAYGSNLNVGQMAYRCPDAEPIGVSEIKDYKLLFKGSKTGSYLTIERAEGRSVPVAIWKVSKQDERNLDRYEGFPTFYFKRNMFLEVKGIGEREGQSEWHDAFVYIMTPHSPVGIPSSLYFKTCAHGYADFGFDIKPLVEAYEESEVMAR